ncbi:MAG: TRAP transporter large permease subunit, partial [Rhodospirillales bacterium]|nr:TRAP transporter large permease subunit [Rhodospirillales bacterium]
NPTLAPRPDTMPPASALEYVIFVIRSLALPVLLIALVLGSIITGWATPTQSGSVGAAGALLLTFFNRSFSFRLLHQVIMRTMLMTAMVFFVVIGATVFSYTFRYFGGDDVILGFLNGLGLGDWGILIFILSIIFVLGFFIDWIEITLITLPIFLPILKVLDFSDHLGSPELALGWIGVLIAINLQTSFLTPPFGFALFFLKGSAPASVNMGHIYRGIVPFVLIQLFGLGLVMAFPDIATWLPRRILE